MIDGIRPHGSYSDRETRQREARFRAAHPYDRGTWQQNEDARADIDPWYAEDDPSAPDALYLDDDAPDDMPEPPSAVYGAPTCPYHVGSRMPRHCTLPAGHDGGHDWPTERELRARIAASAPTVPVAPRKPTARPDAPKRGARTAAGRLVSSLPRGGRSGPARPASRKTRAARKPSAPVMQPNIVARDGGRSQLAPCPRCKRIDWQTVNGRQWHLDNYPRCADVARHPQHQYLGA